MDNSSVRSSRAIAPATGAALLYLLAGCQSYERSPLNILDYRDGMAARISDAEPVSSFLERLTSQGCDVPDRFDPSDGISLAEGEVLALFYNPDLRLVRDECGHRDPGLDLAPFFRSWQRPELADET